MQIVFLTALGVGGATVAGAVIGFFLRWEAARFADNILAFSAGIMLCAAVFSLIAPALETQIIIAVAGIFAGALCMDALQRLVERMRPNHQAQNQALLFVTAIAIHNLPEGIAAGVGFGTGSTGDALMIAGSIAAQNLPEGMVIISPLLASGVSSKRTFLYALGTGVIEVIGTLLGYFAITVSSAILPFALAFAGGTMLFIICREMISATCNKSGPVYWLTGGFCVMAVLNTVI